MLGGAYTSEVVSVLSLALAGGSILYVILSIVHAGMRNGGDALFAGSLLGGLVLGVATEMVIVAAGV